MHNNKYLTFDQQVRKHYNSETWTHNQVKVQHFSITAPPPPPIAPTHPLSYSLSIRFADIIIQEGKSNPMRSKTIYISRDLCSNEEKCLLTAQTDQENGRY